MKMTRQAKARLLFFSPFCILAILVFAFKLGSYTKTIYDLENETAKLERLYSDLQDEGDNLKTEITKLHDPEYIARYARENYDYSKEGEIIIKIADSKSNIEKIKKNQKDDRFVLIVISFIIILMIFIYIIGKANQIRKNNKKSKQKK